MFCRFSIAALSKLCRKLNYFSEIHIVTILWWYVCIRLGRSFWIKRPGRSESGDNRRCRVSSKIFAGGSGLVKLESYRTLLTVNSILLTNIFVLETYVSETSEHETKYASRNSKERIFLCCNEDGSISKIVKWLENVRKVGQKIGSWWWNTRGFDHVWRFLKRTVGLYST